MRCFLASCALATLLLGAVLASHHGDHHDHSHDEDMNCHLLSSPNADFAVDLYNKLKAKTAPGKNIVFSPLGISTALSMLATGAKAETHSQLFAGLHYNALTQTQVNDAYKHLFHMFGHNNENQQLDVGNAVAVRTGFNPLETFLNDVKQHYEGDILNVDFTKAAEAAAEINKYIASKTNNKIKDMVKDLDSNMAMVLLNCVYFRGKWEKPFDGNLTKKAVFNVDTNTQVTVDMMKRTGRFDFYQDMENHTTAILLPYKGNTSMMVILPDEGKMEEVEGLMNKEYIKYLHDSAERHSVDLSIPKFSISAEATLDATLKEMGIVNAFSDNADFSGMSDEIPLKLTKVSHQATLSVDETGTEATAATTLEVMPMSMPESMVLNRPFIIHILEHSTKSILFSGKINDPTAM